MGILTGKTMGRYEIKELLGQGGMAEVYRAYQPALDRYVAVKVLHPFLLQEEGSRARFQREARAVAALRHPHIVQVFDFDVQDNAYFMVMELIDGPNLKQILPAQPGGQPRLSLERIGEIITAIGGALGYAHRQGMIHRDVKPHNIMFTASNHPLLTDFGIARIVSGSSVTASGGVSGTPAYLSPEQGQGAPLDLRTDIYSLGVVLYEMLTGQVPFDADTPFGVIMRHIRDPLPLPHIHMPDIPPALEAVVLKAMAKAPEDRFPSADAMVRATQEALGLPAPAIGVTSSAFAPDGFSAGATTGAAAADTSALAGRLSAGGATPVLGTRTLPPCPYRGLFAFREEDAAFFCGRAVFTDRLIDAVQKRPLTVVMGPSGSGKSSVVFAGLVPALRAQGDWLILSVRPGDRPFHALAALLIPLLEAGSNLSELDRLVEINKLAERFQQGDLTLRDVVGRVVEKNPAAGRGVLVIDQFEELYTLCHDSQMRLRFLDLLLVATASELDARAPLLRIVATMRADFLGHALSYRPLADALEDADLKMGPMTRGELRTAIEEPARHMKVRIEQGLTERILAAVSTEPGDLPLLEFALTLLWDHQRQGMLTHAGYEEIGGVEQALASYAEETYTHLREDVQERARRVFMQLVRPGEGTADTRRVAGRAEIGDANWDLVTQLADARLVVTGHDEAGDEDTVEVVHEALIANWGRLRAWIDADRKFRTWQERLRAGLQQWVSSGRDEGALLRGGPLAEAESWQQERGAELSRAEAGYIEAGLALRNRERLGRERARRTIIGGLVAGLLIAVLLAGLAALQWQQADQQRAVAATQKQLADQQRQDADQQRRIADQQRQDADQQRRIADQQRQDADQQRQVAEHRFYIARAQALGAQAVTQEHATELGVLLAMEAISTTLRLNEPPLPEAVSALHLAFLHSQLRLNLQGHTGAVNDAAYSPDGTRVVTAGADGTVRVWDATSGKSLLVVGGSPSEVLSAAYSPDGKSILTANQDGTARIWDATAGQPRLTLSGHGDEVNHASWSPDGKRIATAGADGTARIWDAAGGKLLLTLSGHDRVDDNAYHHGVTYVAFSPDGRTVATAGADATVRTWDAATGRPLLTLEGHDDPVLYVDYSPDGRSLASASDDYTARIWDATTGEVRATLKGHTDSVHTAVYSPDGRALITTSDDKTVKIWDVATAQVRMTLHGHTAKVEAAAYSPDGHFVVTAGTDATAKVWDMREEELPTLAGHTDTVWDAAYSRDGKTILTASEDGTARLWDAATGQVRFILRGHEAAVDDAIWSPDNASVVTCSEDHTAIIWDAATGKPRFTLQHDAAVHYAAWSPDSRILVTTSADMTAKVWDAATGKVIATLRGHESELWGAAFSKDGHMLVTSSDDKAPRVWDTQTWQLRFTLDGHTGAMQSADFSPDSRSIVTANDDATAKVWDAATGQLRFTLMGHTARVGHAGWSPDSRIIDTVSADHTVKLWDAATGKELVTLRGHTEQVLSAQFNGDGTRIVTASDDGTAKLWDVATGQELATLPGHTGGVQFAAWSYDGRHIVTASADGTARQYVAGLEDLLALGGRRATRNLTPEEAATYLEDVQLTPGAVAGAAGATPGP